jgi:hypothetical protein
VEVCDPDTCPNAFGVVVDDALIALRKWGHSVVTQYGKHTELNIDSLFLSVFAPVRRAFQATRAEGRATNIYVCLFDKASMVTVAKQPEQAKRDAGNQTAESTENRPTAKGSASVLWPAHAWRENISDRSSRQEVIRLLCRHAEKVMPEWLGDCEDQDYIVVLDYEGALGEPCIKTIVGPAVTGFDAVEASESFSNSLGEFDVSSLHYLYSDVVRRHCQGTHGVLIRSIDSDMLPIMMLNTLPGRCDALGVRVQLSIKGVPHLVSPSAVALWAHGLLARPTLTDSVNDFVTLYILSGSDFAPGVPGLGNRAFVLGFLTRPATTPAEYIHTVSASDLVLPAPRFSDAGNRLGVRLPGTKRASKNVVAQRAEAHTDEHIKRAEWCLSYWSHSAYEPTKMLVTPLGHGFDIVGGKVVLAEDIRGPKAATKRIKLCE